MQADGHELGSPRLPKLPQSEAILEAIIRSTKQVPMASPENRGFTTPTGLHQVFRQLGDALVPWRVARWLSAAVLTTCFALRIVVLQRAFFITYLLSIHLLNQVLLFLSPSSDSLPSSSGEYRPFTRALSEFRLWVHVACCTGGSLILTFSEQCDIDVDPWILLLYFTALFAYNMKQQIMHMIRHGYVPWSGSKVAKREPRPKNLDV
uniref:Protein RER1 n=1 Tax=Noctiluca scintillans TaxID=2966 RepID=A0A7S1ANY5_NOCSC